MATVVVVFCSTPARSSTPTLASVMSSSVRSGAVSLIAPTRVVLPTPKPPATRILAVAALGATAGEPGSDSANAIDHCLEETGVGGTGRGGRGDGDEFVVQKVIEEHPYDRDGQVETG